MECYTQEENIEPLEIHFVLFVVFDVTFQFATS